MKHGRACARDTTPNIRARPKGFKTEARSRLDVDGPQSMEQMISKEQKGIRQGPMEDREKWQNEDDKRCEVVNVTVAEFEDTGR